MMSQNSSQAELEDSKRIEKSVDTMKQLYSVLVGLALTTAIISLVQTTDNGMSIKYAALPWFVALVFTLIPFHHGNLRYLDETYVYSNVRHQKWLFLIDYLILFTEAAVLVWLALVLATPESFWLPFFILLSIDVIWAIAQIILPGRYTDVRNWLFINVVALLIIAIVQWYPFGFGEPIPVLDWAQPIYLVLVAILRTVADYASSWSFYFPTTEAESVKLRQESNL